MVITKREDLTKQGFCKYSEENSFFGEVSHLYLFNFFEGGDEKGKWGVVGAGTYLSLSERGRGWGGGGRLFKYLVACEKNATFRDATTGFCERRLEFPY